MGETYIPIRNHKNLLFWKYLRPRSIRLRRTGFALFMIIFLFLFASTGFQSFHLFGSSVFQSHTLSHADLALLTTLYDATSPAVFIASHLHPTNHTLTTNELQACGELLTLHLQHAALPTLVCGGNLSPSPVNFSRFHVGPTSNPTHQEAGLRTYQQKRNYFAQWIQGVVPSDPTPVIQLEMVPFGPGSRRDAVGHDAQLNPDGDTGNEDAYQDQLHPFPLVHDDDEECTFMTAEHLRSTLFDSVAQTHKQKDLTKGLHSDIHVEYGGYHPIEAGSSTIHCGRIDAWVPHRYCITQNVSLQSSLLNEVMSRDTGLDVPPQFGALEASCGLDETKWFEDGFGAGAQGWLFEGLNVMDPEHPSIPCDAWVTTPVFFLSRWDTTNAYQFHQDAINTFLVYALAGLHALDTQVVLLDRRDSDGPFTAAWTHVFSGTKRLLDVYQLVDAVRQRTLHPTPRVCFRRAVWGLHGGVSPLSYGGRVATPCTAAAVPSGLLLAFREFVLARLGMDWKVVGEAKGRELVVTYAVRGEPVRRNRSDTSRLLKEQRHGLLETHAPPYQFMEGTNPRPKRTIANDDEVQKMVQTSAEKVQKAQCANRGDKCQPRKVTFRAVDFALMDWEDQVQLAQKTDLFVGAHGAVFAYLLYMGQGSGAVELKPSERDEMNEQFRNVCERVGVVYEKVSYSGGELKWKELEKVGEAVERQVERMLRRHVG